MHHFFDRKFGHYVLSPYPPTKELDGQVKMHHYFDEKRGCYILSFYPPTKVWEDLDQERNDLYSLKQSILDAPLTFDPTPILLPALKSNHNVPTAQLIDVAVNHHNEFTEQTESLLDKELAEERNLPTPILLPVHRVPTAQLIDVAVNPHKLTEHVCIESLLDKKLAEERNLPTPVLLPVRITPPFILNTHAKKHTRSSTMKQLWILLLQCKVIDIFIVLICVTCSAKFADPRAPSANYSEVLAWSLLTPNIRYASKKVSTSVQFFVRSDTTEVTLDNRSP